MHFKCSILACFGTSDWKGVREKDGWAKEGLLKKSQRKKREERQRKREGRNTFMGDKDSDATESFQGRPKSHYGECNGAD